MFIRLDGYLQRDRRQSISGRLSLGLYSTCKAIYQECPSLCHLLTTGAIVPCVQFEVYENGWQLTKSDEFLNMVLSAASRLRIICDYIFNPLAARNSTVHLQHWWWPSPLPSRKLIKTFLEGNSEQLSSKPGPKSSLLSKHDEHDGLVTVQTKSTKILEVSSLCSSRTMSNMHRSSLSLLLNHHIIGGAKVLNNITAIELIGGFKNSGGRGNLNEEVAKWLVEFRKQQHIEEEAYKKEEEEEWEDESEEE